MKSIYKCTQEEFQYLVAEYSVSNYFNNAIANPLFSTTDFSLQVSNEATKIHQTINGK